MDVPIRVKARNTLLQDDPDLLIGGILLLAFPLTTWATFIYLLAVSFFGGKTLKGMIQNLLGHFALNSVRSNLQKELKERLEKIEPDVEARLNVVIDSMLSRAKDILRQSVALEFPQLTGTIPEEADVARHQAAIASKVKERLSLT